MNQNLNTLLGSLSFTLMFKTFLVLLIICLFIGRFNDVTTRSVYVNRYAEQRSPLLIRDKINTNIASNITRNPDLLLFTTMFKSNEKDPVTNKVFTLWNSWRPAIQPLVFASDEMREDARKFDWPILPEGPKNPKCLGPPLFPNMYIEAMKYYNATFYGYSNADMVYDDGLIHTFNALLKNKTLLAKPLLITGTRIDFDFEKYGRLIISSKDVELLAPQGEQRRYAMDYWITTKTFPWKDVIPLSAGKPMFGRWTLAFAMEHKDIIMIDTSKTINSLHLSTKDGNRSSWEKPGNDCNVDIVKNGTPQIKLMQLGRPECAELETYWDKNSVGIRERKPSEVLCKAYYNPDMKQGWNNFWDDPNHKRWRE